MRAFGTHPPPQSAATSSSNRPSTTYRTRRPVAPPRRRPPSIADVERAALELEAALAEMVHVARLTRVTEALSSGVYLIDPDLVALAMVEEDP